MTATNHETMVLDLSRAFYNRVLRMVTPFIFKGKNVRMHVTIDTVVNAELLKRHMLKRHMDIHT